MIRPLNNQWGALPSHQAGRSFENVGQFKPTFSPARNINSNRRLFGRLQTSNNQTKEA